LAFATPLTITINSVAMAMNRVNNDNFGSEWIYRSGIETLTMKIRHSTDAPLKTTGVTNLRHNVQVIHRVFATPTTKEFIRTWNYTIVVPDYDDPAVGLLDLTGIAAAIVTSTHHTDLLTGLN
jgi:hypothetical protein